MKVVKNVKEKREREEERVFTSFMGAFVITD
jgi:hypothetical protein